ncbi:MAG: VOC family protein [Betaproteobacteria bacterium]
MAMKSSTFSWYDLMTPDTAAAAKFYKAVFGWTTKDVTAGGTSYATFSTDKFNIGGMMPLTDDARKQGTPPYWNGYVLVDNVDDYAERIKKAGGKVLQPPVDVPGILRFAVVADPQGAVFIIFKGMQAPMAEEPQADTLGNVGWHELHAGDGETAFDFYEKLFAWKKTRALDMGELGSYQLFTQDTGADSGGMMTKMKDVPAPFWMFYFNVDSIDAAVERVNKAGGKVAMGPHQVPTGQWIANCMDPQGAWFSMLSKTK